MTSYDPFCIFHSEFQDPALFRGLHKRPCTGKPFGFLGLLKNDAPGSAFNHVCGGSKRTLKQPFQHASDRPSSYTAYQGLPSTPRHKIKYLEPPKPSNTFKNHLLSICQQSSSVGLQVLFLALICQPSRPEINGKIRFAQDWLYSLAHMIH